MSEKMPKKVAKEIKERVFEEAEKFNYLARSRTDNGTFISQLISLESVGGRLAQYMAKADVRHYIKDGILNRYSKDKTQKEHPDDFVPIIQELLGVKALYVEREDKITLFKSLADNCFVVVASGTYLKWETALRKALLYIASKPFSEQGNMKINIMLSLFARHKKVSPSDLRHLQKSLKPCNALAFVYGEN